MGQPSPTHQTPGTHATLFRSGTARHRRRHTSSLQYLSRWRRQPFARLRKASRIMSLEGLNALPAGEASQEFLKCCGSKRWAEAMTARRPYESIEELTRTANEIWWSLEQSDWLEAFRSHPKIGEKKAAKAVSEEAQKWS